MKVSRPLFALCLTVSLLLGAEAARAQSVVSIGEGFACLTNIDGSKNLVREGEGAGFSQVKFSRVAAYVDREREIVEDRRSQLSEILQGKPSLVTRLLLAFLRKFSVKFPTSGVATEFSDATERKEAVTSVRTFVGARIAALRALLKAAKACKGKSNDTPSRNPDLFTPSLKLVSFSGTQSAYAGFVAFTNPRTNPFNKTPGGFNVCQKLTSADGSESRLYTGAGDEICFTGGGIVDDNAVAACNAQLPAGTVGRFIKIAQGTDLSSDGLRNLEQIAVANTPTVVFLGLNNFQGSRDEAVALCQTF